MIFKLIPIDFRIKFRVSNSPKRKNKNVGSIKSSLCEILIIEICFNRCNIIKNRIPVNNHILGDCLNKVDWIKELDSPFFDSPDVILHLNRTILQINWKTSHNFTELPHPLNDILKIPFRQIWDGFNDLLLDIFWMLHAWFYLWKIIFLN